MAKNNNEETRLDDSKKYDSVVTMLNNRGVKLEDIAEITFDLQDKYIKDLSFESCLEHVERVVMKREVQHAIFTGVELDMLAEKNMLSEPLLSMLNNDEPLYGIDEILALAIVNVYGSIGFTNFGYVDKVKPKILKILDDQGKEEGRCNTFLDDIVGAIAAAAASSIAHRYAD